jgi:hypothetical protein
MAFQDRVLALFAFKNLLGFSMTDISKEASNESEGIAFNIHANTVFVDPIDSNPTVAQSASVVEYIQADMVLDPTSNGHAYFAVYPTGHTYAGQRVRNAVPPTYGYLYYARPKDQHNNDIAQQDARMWIYQYNSGVFFQQVVNATLIPTKIELYVYVGTNLTQRLSQTVTGTVTSVGLSLPTGLEVTGSPITTTGTFSVSFQTGYSIPTNNKQSNWDTAFSWGDHSGLYSLVSHTHTFASITGKPTTLTGYGITDAVPDSRTITINGTTNQVNVSATAQNLTVNRTWTLSLPQNIHTGASPTFAGLTLLGLNTSGFVRTNASGVLSTAALTATDIPNLDWSKITTGKPTTLAGYGITDAMSTTHAANSLTPTNISNWNTAYDWGNHATVGYLTNIDSGTTNYVMKWNGSTLANSQIFDNGTSVGIGLTSGLGARLHVRGSGNTSSSFAMRVDSSSVNNLFTVRDDGNIGINNTPSNGAIVHINAPVGYEWGTIIQTRATSPSESILQLRDSGSNNMLIVYTNGMTTINRNLAVGWTSDNGTEPSDGVAARNVYVRAAHVSNASSRLQVSLNPTVNASRVSFGDQDDALKFMEVGAWNARNNIDNKNRNLAIYPTNVFIGNSSEQAQAKVHVVGTGSTSSTFAFRVDSATVNNIFTVRDNGQIGIGGNIIASTDAVFDLGTVSANRIRRAFISNNISIGTNANWTASNALDVIGNIRTSSLIVSDGTWVTNNASVTTGPNTTEPVILRLQQTIAGSSNMVLGGTAGGGGVSADAYIFFADTMRSYAAIRGIQTGQAWNNEQSGDIVFLTTTNISLTPITERMRIVSDGRIIFGNGESNTVANLTSVSISATSVNSGISNGSAATSIFYINGARGTGTGVGGGIVLRTAPASINSGTTQNSLVDRLTIASNGNITFATNSATFIANGGNAVVDIRSGENGFYPNLRFFSENSSSSFLNIGLYGPRTLMHHAGRFYFGTISGGSGNHMSVHSDGLWLFKNGIGYFDNTYALAKVHVVGTGSTSSTFAFRVDSATVNNIFTVRDDGLVSFGSNLTVTGNLSITSFTSGRIPYTGAGGQLLDTNNLLWTNNTNTLRVNGTLEASSKSFVINHPTKTGKKLVYGSLEGPENGVYVRGRLKGNNVIELPEYWINLVDEDTVTVQLTPIGRGQNLYIEYMDNKTVVIGNENDCEINCSYLVLGERKDIDKLITERNE